MLGAQLITAFHLGRGGPGGWWVLFEPEVHLGDNVLVPDIAGWLRADVPAFDTSVAYFEEVPRWVAEVLSPSTERLDRIKKLRLYHQAGIAFVWLVHPVLHTLEVYERHEGGYLLIETPRRPRPSKLNRSLASTSTYLRFGFRLGAMTTSKPRQGLMLTNSQGRRRHASNAALIDADFHLERLKLYNRLAVQLRLSSVGRHEHLARQLDELARVVLGKGSRPN